jgi:copper chaperone CopZ
MVIRVLAILLITFTARAEFLRMEVSVRDMDCESCSVNLEGAFKRIRGVEKAEVDYKARTIRIELTEKNRVGIDQIWDATKRVGFTPGDTKVSVRGTLKGSKLEVPEIGKTFEVEGKAPEGDSVTVSGTITPPPDPRTPIVIHLNR